MSLIYIPTKTKLRIWVAIACQHHWVKQTSQGEASVFVTATFWLKMQNATCSAFRDEMPQKPKVPLKSKIITWLAFHTNSESKWHHTTRLFRPERSFHLPLVLESPRRNQEHKLIFPGLLQHSGLPSTATCKHGSALCLQNSSDSWDTRNGQMSPIINALPSLRSSRVWLPPAETCTYLKPTRLPWQAMERDLWHFVSILGPKYPGFPPRTQIPNISQIILLCMSMWLHIGIHEEITSLAYP